ncbi:nucleoid-associated protein [Dyadobacter fanqingshengii]|uniref:Nucleoid-associated protein n=1 Tax=Dyadobacter fanqingshengii TaxID=2906443 RepID=A0A9X1PED6_9BACT|nr:nucleoid-associated protein [Dyadobacter fanqingshengii]MCF0043666.1 nucleoid-associated protein [Dyadobacter fanqingshengii]USJ34718.1 nucleoid-associated protein [Dyadobacter fanqingshengii]
MHTVLPKPKNIRDASASVVARQVLSNIDSNVEQIIKDRLIESSGRRGKAFKLQIQQEGAGSFVDLCQELKKLDDPEFIVQSVKIAQLLADAQTSTQYPGGFLLIIEAVNDNSGLFLYLVIKAEPHQALVSRVNQIEILNEIFLSPSQKLFKIGIIEERTPEATHMNQRFDCFLFDDQFNSDGLPAAYFYNDFLGFSIQANSELQSLRFYRITEDFITNAPDISSDGKGPVLDALKQQFTANKNQSVDPSAFGRTYFKEEKVLGRYLEAISSLPSIFVKNTTLIDSRLKTKKIDFPSKIKIAGPDAHFDDKVKIIDSQEELNNLIAKSQEYTIVVIHGHPFENE